MPPTGSAPAARSESSPAGVALFLAAYLGFAVDITNLLLLALPFAAAAIGCVETAEQI